MNFNQNQPIDMFVAEMREDIPHVLEHTRMRGTLANLTNGMMSEAKRALRTAQDQSPEKHYDLVICPTFYYAL